MKKLVVAMIVVVAAAVLYADPNSVDSTIVIGEDYAPCLRHDEATYHAKGYVCTAVKRFGKANPPAHWQAWFDNDNKSRLDYLQQQKLDRLEAIIYGSDFTDLQGNIVHKNGLLDRIVLLESLVKNLMKKHEP